MLKFKKVSADEAKNARRAHTKSLGGREVVVKGATSPRSWDADNRSAKFVMTSETTDRYMDIVGQAGMDTSNFEKNPQGLLFHNSRSWPVGNWSDVVKVLGGRPKRTEGVLNFLPEGTDEDADRAARHVAAGSIRTVSIGFIPDWDEIDFILDEEENWTGGFRFNKSELIECSLVPVPANPDAMVKDAGGDMSLARNLVDDVLDTWMRTPEGLLVPIAEYEAKHFELVGQRSSIIVDKSLKEALPKFVESADLKLTATTEEEAKAFNGATVSVDPANTENKSYPFDILAEKRSTGTVISSWIAAEHGEDKDVHVLAVEFFTDDFTGMVRGFKAARYLLAKAAEPAVAEVVEPAENDAGEVEEKDVQVLFKAASEAFTGLIEEGDQIFLSVKDSDGVEESQFTIIRGKTVEQELVIPVGTPAEKIAEMTTAFRAKAAKQETKTVIVESNDEKLKIFIKNESTGVIREASPKNATSLKIDIDTGTGMKELSDQIDEVDKKIEKTESNLDRLLGKVKKFFGGGDTVEKDRIEPPMKDPTPASPEDVSEAKRLAKEAIERITQKGLL